jgi:hypothetical protein
VDSVAPARPTTRLLAVSCLLATLVTGCGGSSEGTGGAATPTAAASSAAAAPTIKPSGSLPPEAAAKQGGKYFAVFLAVAGDAKDPALADAQNKAQAIGYQGGTGDVNCTPGARTALNLSNTGDYTAFSIFFETAQQAQDFVNGYHGKVVGTAYVTAGCLD